MKRSLLLGLDVLDRQVVDRDEELSGKVDEVELERAGDSLRVSALLVGPAAWRDRLPPPLRQPLSRFLNGEVTRIAWQEVAEVDSAVRLTIPASSLQELRVELQPQTRECLRLSSLLGARVLDADGRSRGRVHEVEAERSDGDGDFLVSRLWLGREGLLRRLGLGAGAASAAEIPWAEVGGWNVHEVRLQASGELSRPIG